MIKNKLSVEEQWERIDLFSKSIEIGMEFSMSKKTNIEDINEGDAIEIQ